MLSSAAFFHRPGTPWKLCLDLLQLRGSSSGWQVSSHGRVRNSYGRVSFGTLHRSGYRRPNVEGSCVMVHRLVAAAFLGPPPDPRCWQVNHLDCDPGNNHISNLQYVTHAENQKHSYTINCNRQRGPLKLVKAVWWRRCGEESWSHCSSQSEAARLLGVSPWDVSKCCRGLLRKGRGHGIWYEFETAAINETVLLPEEIWKPAQYPGIRGAIDNLLVSSHGRVSHRCGGFVSYGTRLSHGYHLVNRAGKGFLVHRLVAATFLGEPESPHKEVNHKDSNRGNNHVDNLEYVTRSENTKHAWQQRSREMRRRGSGKAVLARSATMDSSQEPWLEFDSVTKAAAHAGIPVNKISRICRRLDSAVHLKWEFRFAPEEHFEGEEWRPVLLKDARWPLS